MSDALHCLFISDSDGYSYSSETLLGIYRTQDDAETALLECVARAEHQEKLRVKYNEDVEAARALGRLEEITDLYERYREAMGDFREWQTSSKVGDYEVRI